MYTPQRRNNQSGGQTIPSGLLPATTGATTSALGPSTISSITGLSGLSSFTNVSQYSIDQLSSLIRALDSQIRSEQVLISQNQSDIATLENKITRRPDGLQPQFELADFIYTSTLNEYNAQLRMMGFYQSTMSTKVQRLVQVSSLTDRLQSTVTGYEIQYSTILSSLGGIGTTLQSLSTSYLGYMNQMSMLSTNLVTSQLNEQRALTDLSTYSSCVSTSIGSYSSVTQQSVTAAAEYTNLSTIELPAIQTTVENMRNAITDAITNPTQKIADIYAGLLTADTGLAPLLAQSTTLQTDKATAESNLATAQAAYDAAVAAGDTTAIDSAKTTLDTLSVGIVTQDATILSNDDAIASYIQSLQTTAETTFSGSLSTLSIGLATDLRSYEELQSSINGLSTFLGTLPISQNALLASYYNCSTAVISSGAAYSRFAADGTRYATDLIQTSAFAASTLSTMESLSGLSTAYAFSIGYYISSFTALSTQEAFVNSTIYALTQNRDLLANQITTLEQQVVVLVASSFSEVSRLQGNADKFYMTKNAAVVAEVNQIGYAARQLNSFIGAQCADMILRKLALLNKIDTANFQLSVTPNDTTLTAKLNDYSLQKLFLDGLIQKMQALEPEFAKLLKTLTDEAIAKSAFVRKRQEITNMDIMFLDDPTKKTANAFEYSKKWIQLEEIRTTVNAAIQERSAQLSTIYSMWDPIVPDIRSIVPTVLFPQRILVSNTPIRFESNDPTQPLSALSEYALIPPTSFI